MRKLKLQMQTTVDGFVAGPNGEMDWVSFNWGPDINSYVAAITEPVDCIILGRKLAEGFIPHWASHPDELGATKINSTPKVVFTKTMEHCDWSNTVLAKGDLTEKINRLKNQEGGDIIAYGGGGFVSSLIKNRLIDEFNLFINPAAIGRGMTIFADLSSKQDLKLEHAQAFEGGIVALRYSKG
jgi:dihydrofolate reductase